MARHRDVPCGSSEVGRERRRKFAGISGMSETVGISLIVCNESSASNPAKLPRLESSVGGSTTVYCSIMGIFGLRPMKVCIGILKGLQIYIQNVYTIRLSNAFWSG